MTESTGRDLAAYADKVPSDHNVAFAAWITENTGVKVDVKSISLAVALVHEYQKSPENKARRAEAAKAAKVAAAEKKAAAPAKKAGNPAKKTAAPAKKATVVSSGAPKKAAPAKKKAGALKAVDPVF